MNGGLSSQPAPPPTIPTTGSSAEPRCSFLFWATPPLGPQAPLHMLPGVGGREEHSPLSISSSHQPRVVDHISALLNALHDSPVPLGSCPMSLLPTPTYFSTPPWKPCQTSPFPSLHCHHCPQPSILTHTHPANSYSSCWGSQPAQTQAPWGLTHAPSAAERWS